MQIALVTISNKSHFIYDKALLDTGFDATLLTKDIVVRLGLKGSSKQLTITKTVLQTQELDLDL